jgi:hypothetical protein
VQNAVLAEIMRIRRDDQLAEKVAQAVAVKSEWRCGQSRTATQPGARRFLPILLSISL